MVSPGGVSIAVQSPIKNLSDANASVCAHTATGASVSSVATVKARHMAAHCTLLTRTLLTRAYRVDALMIGGSVDSGRGRRQM